MEVQKFEEVRQVTFIYLDKPFKTLTPSLGSTNNGFKIEDKFIEIYFQNNRIINIQNFRDT